MKIINKVVLIFFAIIGSFALFLLILVWQNALRLQAFFVVIFGILWLASLGFIFTFGYNKKDRLEEPLKPRFYIPEDDKII